MHWEPSSFTWNFKFWDFSQYGSLGPWILEPGNLECWKYETLESWNCGTPNLASCNLRVLLSCLQTASPVKNFEPFTLWSCRVDVLLWIILPIPCSLNKLQQLYWALRLLCIALVISLLMSQTKDPHKSGSLMLGTLNPGNLEPQNPGKVDLWNLGTLKICNLAVLETWKSWNPARPWSLVWKHCNLATLGPAAGSITK